MEFHGFFSAKPKIKLNMDMLGDNYDESPRVPLKIGRNGQGSGFSFDSKF